MLLLMLIVGTVVAKPRCLKNIAMKKSVASVFGNN